MSRAALQQQQIPSLSPEMRTILGSVFMLTVEERAQRTGAGAAALGIADAVVSRWAPRADRARSQADDPDSDRLIIDGLIGDPIDEEMSWWGDIFTGPRRLREWLSGLAGGAGTIEINSPGGSYFGGVDMTRLISEHPGPITMVVSGLAASAASLLLTGAKDVEMFRGSSVMIHLPWTYAVGNAHDLRKAAGLLDQLGKDCEVLYKRRMGADRDVMALMAAETWFGVDEAMEVGLVDRELEPRTENDSADDDAAMAAGLGAASARLSIQRRGRR